MIINSIFTVAQPPDSVFELLLDLDAVTPCIPGAAIGAVREDGSREASVSVRFGPMKFVYAGIVRIASVDRARSRAVLEATVQEQSGDGDARARISMRALPTDAGHTRVEVATDLAISGAAAHMGTGMIEAFAEEMLDDFVVRVGRLFEQTSASDLGYSDAPPGNTAHPSAPAQLDDSLHAVRLLLRLLRRRGRHVRRNLDQRWRRKGRGPVAAPRNSGLVPPAFGREPEVDLLVVGSGSGALAGAIAGHDAGLRVALYEKAPRIGGGSAYSGGVVWAPCNHIMRRKRIPDSVEAACQYLEHASGGRGDADVQHRYVTTVGPLIEQLERWTGISWVIWTGQPDYYPELPGAAQTGRAILPHPSSASEVLVAAESRCPALSLVRPTPHMDFVPGFQTSDRPPRDSWLAGRSIIGGLWKALLERGIEYHVSAPVVDLLHDGDAVVGVRVEPVGEEPREVRAHAVLLNTGGFDWNAELTRLYLPGPTVHPQTPPSNTGDGHVLAMRVGAGTALLDKAIWHPSIQIPGDTHEEGQDLYRMFNMELSKPHCMVVNRAGRRFATEAAYYALAAGWAQVDPLTQKYPNVPSYFVCDALYRARYGLPGLRDTDYVPAWISCAETLPQLGAQLGIDPDGLMAEVETFNMDAAVGADSRFGRGATAYERYWGDPEYEGANPTMGPVMQPPFYGFPLHLAHAGTRGGVRTSADGQVLRVDGSPIPGLYACGNVAANLLFGAGYASGSAVGSSLVFGYLSALHVAAALAVLR